MAHPETARTFRFEFAPSYRWPATVFGVRPTTTWVTVTATHLLARFGPWTVHTPLSNVCGTEITGPYAFPKTAGPAHLSFSDRGLTFATTGRQGLQIDFVEPVTGLDPFGRLHHPNLTVTVEEPEALAAALRTTAAGVGTGPA